MTAAFVARIFVVGLIAAFGTAALVFHGVKWVFGAECMGAGFFALVGAVLAVVATLFGAEAELNRIERARKP